MNLIDANRLMAQLDLYRHWTVKVGRRGPDKMAYECTILHDGRRVTAYRNEWPAAVLAAIEKLKAPATKRERTTRGGSVLRLAKDEP